MFAFLSRFFTAGCKQRLVSAAPTLSSPTHPSRLFSQTDRLLPLVSDPILSSSPRTSSFHSLAFLRGHQTPSNPKTLVDAVSRTCSIDAASIRLQSTDFTVRDSFEVVQSKRNWSDLERAHRALPKPRRRVKLTPIGYNPHLKGVVLRTLIKKPKKPNSANRKCVLVRLSNGKECVAFVPGEGHNLQEHSTVLCEPRRSKDLIGVHVRVVRGKYDCAPVKKKI